MAFVNINVHKISSGERELGDGEKMACSLAAGVASALVSSPAELVMIQQVRHALVHRYRMGSIKHSRSNAYILIFFWMCIAKARW